MPPRPSTPSLPWVPGIAAPSPSPFLPLSLRPSGPLNCCIFRAPLPPWHRHGAQQPPIVLYSPPRRSRVGSGLRARPLGECIHYNILRLPRDVGACSSAHGKRFAIHHSKTTPKQTCSHLPLSRSAVHRTPSPINKHSPGFEATISIKKARKPFITECQVSWIPLVHASLLRRLTRPRRWSSSVVFA